MRSHFGMSFAAGSLLVLSALFFAGCSSTPPMKSQAYAKLKNERTFENDFSTVWKAIEETFRNYRIKERDPKEVDALEMRKLTKRTLETDWIYGQSRDKYQEYQVNGFPKKVYLQTRFKYELEAKKVMGGIHTTVKTEEEVERLKSDGTPNGYESVDENDTSRANEILDKIQNNILAAPNTSSE